MPSICLFTAPLGENGPCEQWPDPLKAGISKGNRKKLECFGKVPVDANWPNLSNRLLRLHSSEPGETEEVINAADYFHLHRSQHSTLGLSQNAASNSLTEKCCLLLETVIPLEIRKLLKS